MIEVENLTKYYGPRAAIRDLNFEVAKGEILGFLGPNGAGKTTTMRILTGYLPPTSGTATVAGYNVFTQSLEARRHVGYLPESVPLYTEMEVADYLRFMARIRGVPGRNQRARVDYVMEALNITHVRDRIIGKLSKGYRQRVGIAQALVADPDVLILDEPTIGLDPKQIIETRNLIRDLAGNHTVILSTHILPEVSATCQRVLIINDGEIAADGTSTYTVACALGHDLREQLAATVVGQGCGLLELRPVRLSLEEIFLEIITEEHETAELVEA